MHASARRGRSATILVLAILAIFALIAAGCGGDDDDDGAASVDGEGAPIEPGEPNETDSDGRHDTDEEPDGTDDGAAEEEPTAEPTEPAGPVFTDPELDARLQEATDAIIETMFECGTEPAEGLTATERGVTADTISIAFLENDWTTLVALNTAVDLGPEGDHFRAFVDQINECGGIHGRRIEVNVYRFDPINFPQQDATCIEATAEDENLLVVARILTRESPLCIVEQNETPLITSSQFPRDFYDRADGRLFGVDPTGDELLDLIARDLVATEVIGPDTVLGILSPDGPLETFAVRDGLIPALEELGIDYVDVVIPSTGLACEGYNTAVSRFQEAGVTHVMPTLGPTCYPPFVLEATALGWFPQYIATPFGGMTSNTSTQRLVDAGDAFDGAIGVHTLPGEAFYGGPAAPFEQACNDITNEVLGYDYVYGDTVFGAITVWCTIALALQQGLEAAGPDLTRESFIAGMETVTDVPLRRGGLGSFGPDKRTLVENVVWGQTWRSECGCWREPNGPREVG
jgi:ABC-type branched-subunit amino acid transport system substrate-binding protein